MKRKIINPKDGIEHNNSFPKDFKKGLIPLRGSIQKNYMSHKKGVIHISPVDVDLEEHERIICSKWVYPDKPDRISTIQRNARTHVEMVKTPKILLKGRIVHEGNEFPYWIEEFIEGQELTSAVLTGTPLQTYRDIIYWLSKFHVRHESLQSLRGYYSDRFSTFRKILTDCGLMHRVGAEDKALLKDAVRDIGGLVESCIDSDERLDLIHGDLQGSNIMIKNYTTTIMDFEQGVNGGDWFSDLSKLLRPDTSQFPDYDKPYKYLPSLNFGEKKSLIRSYVTFREERGWKKPMALDRFLNHDEVKLFELRNKISQFDNVMSVWCIRKLSGEDYYINDKGERGAKFALEIIRRKYGR